MQLGKNVADWHLSKTVTIGVILSLLLNSASVIWWGSGLNTDVSNLKQANLEERVIKLEVLQSENAKVMQKLNDTLDKVDVTVKKINDEQQKRTVVIEAAKKKLL